MKNTKQNLKRISQAYDRNFAFMIKYVDTPKHAHYIRRENKLNEMDVHMRKRLGIYVNSPCRLHNQNTICENCNGWIKSVYMGKTKFGAPRRRYKMSEVGIGEKCSLKEVLHGFPKRT